MSANTAIDPKSRKKREWLVFLFLSVCLAPILAIGLVGSWGFIVWFSQMIFGPPTH
jgi:periplasmic nitrate reductase NapE